MPHVTGSAGLFALWVCLILLCEGGHFTLVPNILKKVYGGERGTALYGIMFSYTSIAAILMFILQIELLTD